jgi:multiple sugar transport system permease protein
MARANTATASAGTTPGARRHLSERRREELLAWLFISPWVIGFLVFTVGAMLASFGISLFETDLLAQFDFVGLRNYAALPADSLFTTSLRVTLVYTALTVPLSTIVALAIALLLNQKIRGASLWRTVYYLPAVVSGVAVALIWNWVLNADSGLLNQALRGLGLPAPRWFASEFWALPGLVLIALWGTGTNMLLYLAGLQGIPTEMAEAAQIDGAGPIRTFFSVTLPLLTPTIFFNVVINIIGSFQVFTNAYVLTDGGPNNATKTLVLYLYQQGFRLFHFGYASAIGWVLFLIVLIFTLILVRTSSSWVHYEGGLRR